MNEITIITPQAPDTGSITIRPEIVQARNELLATIQSLPPINSDEACSSALNVVRKAKAMVSQTEKDRTTLKAPFLEVGRKLDAVAREFSDELKEACRAVETKIGAYNLRQQQLREEEQRKQREELARLEEQRLAAEREAEEAARKVAEADAPEARKEALKEQLAAEERADETQSAQVSTIQQMADIPRSTVSGGAQRFKVEVDVTDIKALYAAFPHCVKMTPVLGVIKSIAETNPDKEIPGVKITKTPIFTVRSA